MKILLLLICCGASIPLESGKRYDFVYKELNISGYLKLTQNILKNYNKNVPPFDGKKNT